MKTRISISLAFAALLSLASCDSYLDELPDDRAELNTLEKTRQILTSAYPTNSPNYLSS